MWVAPSSQQSWSNKGECALLTHNSACSIRGHNPTGMRRTATQLKSMWQNDRGDRRQKEGQRAIVRPKRVAYDGVKRRTETWKREKEAKSGGGGGGGGVIPIWRLRKEERSGAETEAAKREEAKAETKQSRGRIRQRVLRGMDVTDQHSYCSI